MATKSDSKKQRAALKKLRTAGLYGGKIPRGKLNKYQQSLVNKFDAVVKGKAKVVSPKNPKDYSKLYQVKGSKVIVPRAPGEKISINKNGNVVRERKGPRGEPIKSTSRRTKPGELPPKPVPPKQVRYAIPFARKLGKGRYALHWQRFPTWDALAAFMATYEKEGRYEDWTNFVFEEEISDTRPKAERDRALNEAAVQYGRANSLNDFEVGSQLSSVMREGRRNRRRKTRRKDYGG